jgi:HK97 family phage major capsid protein
MRRDDTTRLREQLFAYRGDMQDLLDVVSAAGRDMTQAETLEFDEKRSKAAAIQRQLESGNSSRNRGTGEVRALRPLGEGSTSDLAEWRRRERGVSRAEDDPDYGNSFFSWLTSRDLNELDPEEWRALSKASGPVGAYLVPTSFGDNVVRSTRFMGSIGSLATTIDTDSGEAIQIPANTAHGTAAWIAEAGTYTPTDETFAQVTLNAFKAGTSIVVSEELLQDSAFALDTYLATEFGERIGVLEETAYVNGTGTGQPQGLATVAGGVSVITAASGNSTTFDYPSIMSLIYGVPPQYRQGASFVMSDGAEKNLRLLRDTNQQPLWQTSLSEGTPNTFCGFPVSVHPDMAAPAASAKSIMFGNWKRAYTIRRVQGFNLQRQVELYSNSGQVGWRGYERVDGRIVLADAARILAHSAT